MEQRHAGLHHGNQSGHDDFSQEHGGSMLSMQLHGVCMIVGWWLFLPAAMFSARYFRKEMSETVCKTAMWFQCHRLMACIGVGFVTAGLVSILVHTGGVWTSEKKGSTFSHSVAGMAAIVGVLLQPLVALFRCHPEHPKRFIFTWFHRCLGVCVWLLAQAAIMWATFIPYSGLSPASKLGNVPRAVILIYWLVISVFIGCFELFEKLEKTSSSTNIENGYTPIDSQLENAALHCTKSVSKMNKESKLKAILWSFFVPFCLLLTGLFVFFITDISKSLNSTL